YTPNALFSNYPSGGILATGQYDLALFNENLGLDPDSLYVDFHSSQIPSASNPDGGNWERVNDPLIDHALDEGRITLDGATRRHIYQALQLELVGKVDVVPLYLSPDITLVNPTIGNEQDNPFYGPGQGNLWNIGDWFLIK